MVLFPGPFNRSRNKDKTLEKHLKTVENVAWKNGLAPEGIDILLNVALSGKFGMSRGYICHSLLLVLLPDFKLDGSLESVAVLFYYSIYKTKMELSYIQTTLCAMMKMASYHINLQVKCIHSCHQMHRSHFQYFS